jgi:hypothetical protein
MDSIRCPMCGKSNPPDTVICEFCQARLEPLIAPPPEENQSNEPLESPDEDSTLPSWLDGLRDDESDQDEELERSDSQEEDSTEDWLIEVGDDVDDRLSSTFPTPLESDAEQDQDWLSRLVGDEPTQEGEETDDSTTEKAPASSAFLGMDELLGEEGSSDWLAEFETSSLGLEEPEELVKDDSADAQETERPHWLDMIRAQKEEEDEPEQPHISKGEIGTPEPGAESAEPPEKTGEADWLADIGIDEGDEELIIDAKGLPAWLTDAEPAELEEGPTSKDAIPGWLTESELAQDKTTSQEGGQLPDWLAQGAEAEPGTTQAPQRELPEWLDGIDESGLPEPVENEIEEAPVAGEENGLPDWLTKLDDRGTYQPTSADSPALIMEDEEQADEPDTAGEEGLVAEGDFSAVPDWLSQISSQEEQAEAPAPLEDELEPDLAEAQLPSWLQAMRPVESAAPSAPASPEEAGKVEQVGPLAGLAGVLAAEPEFIHIRKPQSSLVKLQISDNQQTHITLLENLLAEEGQAKAVEPRSTISSQYFLRLLIALAVLAAVILPLWLNRQILPMPDPAGVSNEVYEFGRWVSELPSGVTALVAFDYEPGFSGELESTAAAVLAEMTDRGVHLAAVSTNPTGPLLAERFALTHLPDLGGDFTNLGYVPGGASGLLALAQSPRDMIPFDLHGARVWETGSLRSFNSLADFGAVIILTENPDTARSWIEQVQPTIGLANKPLLMVLSAQAEPMVRPYYETDPRQVSGMISGLAGGAAFESILGRVGQSRLYWDAFGTGLVIAVGLILVGGLVSLVLALLSKPQKNVEDTL